MDKKLMTVCFSLLAISGMAQTSYPVKEFSRIISQGGGYLQISRSDDYTVRVDASGPCAESVSVSVSSKILYVVKENENKNGCNVKIYVGVPSLDEIVLKGGGNIVMKKGFSPKDTFQCTIRGGGNIDVSGLSVNSFAASINGGGTMLVTAQKALEGNISGGGVIEYSGNPTVTRHISGGGRIGKK